MTHTSIIKEALIATVIAAVVIPLLWTLGAVVNPERDTHSPGLELVVLTLAGAAMVMLLRTVWRNSTDRAPDRDGSLEDWGRVRDSFGGGQC